MAVIKDLDIILNEPLYGELIAKEIDLPNPLGINITPPDGYVVMWKNQYYFEEIMGSDFLESSSHFLRAVSLYGFKFCRVSEYPEFSQYEWKGIIRYKDAFLCIRAKEHHPNQTAVNHAIEKEYFNKMKDLKVKVYSGKPGKREIINDIMREHQMGENQCLDYLI